MNTTQVTEAYLLGIKEGRASLKAHGASIAQDEVANLKATIRNFDAQSSVGQMLRGERDFWLNQIKRAS